MDERNLINKIQILKQVKPSKTWVSFAKAEILSGISEEEVSCNFGRFDLPNIIRTLGGQTSYILKPVAVSLVVLSFLSIFGGTFWITKNTRPGDSFYSLKLTYQTLRMNFSPEEQRPQMHLEYAHQRVEDLGNVSENKIEEGVVETAKVLTDDFSKATVTFKNIKEPAKKFSAGANLVKQVSKIEQSLSREKEILSAESQEKISEVEKLAKETKEEVFASLMEDSENDSDYRQKVEKLQKEVEEYEKQYREQYRDSLGK